MPRIDTLVEDIYKQLDSGDFEIDVPGLAQMINDRLKENQGGGYLRASSIGTECERKIWYSVNKPELAEKLPPNVRLKFLIGDIIETVVLALVEASDHDLAGCQGTIEVAGVKGHRDAIIDGMVVDVKSANSRSFDKFKYHKLEQDDPFAYLDQLGMYIEGSQGEEEVKYHDRGAFLAVDKELGHIKLDVYPKKRESYVELVEQRKEMVSRPRPPARHYADVADGKSGNRVLCMQCKYCPFKDTCWADVRGGAGLRKVVFANGPRWFTVVKKEPAPKTKF